MKLKVSALALLCLFCLGAPTASGQPARKKCRIVHHDKVCPKPKPVSVKSISLRLDPGHAVTKAIAAADGGTITTTAANGTKLTLTIPKDALFEDTTVTLTPVTSISGLPAGTKFLDGAQFGPEGTPLLQTATLTIAASAQAKKLHALAWQGNGKTPITYAASRSGSEVSVKVVHFSGYGEADGEPLGNAALRASLQARYPQVKAEMEQATTTDDAKVVHDAIADWTDWERTAELLNDPSFMASERAALRALFPKLVRNGIEKAYQHCKAHEDVVKNLGALLSYERGTYGLSQADQAELSNLARDDRQKCDRFQLDFETVLTTVGDITSEGGGQIHFSQTNHVRVLSLPLQLFGAETAVPPVVSQSLEVVDFEYDYSDSGGCSGTQKNATPTDPFKVDRLEASPDDVPKISLQMYPGTLTVPLITVTCPGPPPISFAEGTLVVPAVGVEFANLHAAEAVQGPLFVIKDWSYLGGTVWARKTSSNTVTVPLPSGGGSMTITEQTTFDLKHVPE